MIEQRLLPHRFEVVSMRTHVETAAAIRDMVVRGAGAIGATAAFGLAQGVREFKGRGLAAFEKHVGRVFERLKEARPTAVDPVNAMVEIRRRMRDFFFVEDEEWRRVVAEQGMAAITAALDGVGA